MFIPLHDRNPLRIVAFQFVTVLIILACTGLYLWQLYLADAQHAHITYGFGMIPSVLLGVHELPIEAQWVPQPLTLLSYMFLHGNWSHLLGNMLFLWVFGDNIEDAVGHLRFITFYLLCGVVAALIHLYMEPASNLPLIGASGAIAGLLGGYLVLHPRVKILVLVLNRLPLFLPAYLLITLWVSFQLYQAYSGAQLHIAWWAHIGGFVTGALLIVPLRDKSIPLFDRGIRH